MRWRGYECKGKDTGSPIGSGMTEGKKQISLFTRDDNFRDSAMRWRGYECKGKDTGSPIGSGIVNVH